MQKRYIRYVDKDDLNGGDPTLNILGTHRKPQTTSTITIDTIQQNLDDLNIVGIQPALNEINCCFNDIRKIKSSDSKQQKYLDILIGEFKNFATNIENVEKPNNYTVKFNTNDMYGVVNIQKEFNKKIVPIVSALFIGYDNFLMDYINSLASNQLPAYSISPKYVRSNNNQQCDSTVASSRCTDLFGYQKLTTLLNKLTILNTNLQILIKNGYLSDRGLYYDVNQSNFFSDVNDLVINCNDKMKNIQSLQTKISTWRGAHGTNSKLEIPYSSGNIFTNLFK
jgi:hypothetical protein